MRARAGLVPFPYVTLARLALKETEVRFQSGFPGDGGAATGRGQVPSCE